MVTSRKLAVPAYLLIAAAIIAVSTWVVRSAWFAEEPDLLARAVSLDVAILLPGLYWVFATRLGWPRLTVIPVFIASTLIAHAVLPTEHTGFLGFIELLALPLELFALVYVLNKARHVARAYRQACGAQGSGALGGDFVEALEQVLSGTRMPARLAQIAVTEAAVLHYGLLAWGRRASDAPGVAAFPYHVKNGYATIVGGLSLVIIIEATLLHMLLASRVPVLAWILLISSIYGLVFFIADYKAAARRPVLVDDRFLHVRTAFRWRCSIPLEAIASIESSSKDIDDRDGLLDAKLIGGHNVVAKLDRSFVAKGMYGFTKRFDRVAFTADEPSSLVKEVEQRRGQVAT